MVSRGFLGLRIVVIVTCLFLLVVTEESVGSGVSLQQYSSENSGRKFRTGKRSRKHGMHKLRAENELFTEGSVTGGENSLRKQFQNGVVGSAEDAESPPSEGTAMIGGKGMSASAGGDFVTESSAPGLGTVFRKGYQKASYLLGNMTATIWTAGKGNNKIRTATIVHPVTGAVNVYDITNQKTDYEQEDLTMHMCNDPGEAYSAAYLTSREHMLAVKSEDFNLTWVNCEMASFIHMRRSAQHFVNRYNHGMIMQSLDVLDFSAIHLSAFERSSKRYRKTLWKPAEHDRYSEIPAVKEASRILEAEINPKTTGKPIKWSQDAKRTVAVMPFLGGAMGAGHSELGNRFVYIHACFWSVYQFIPNIVVGVSRQQDVEWAMKDSGLPFYDVILLDNLPKSAGLPVGTVQAVKKRLSPGGAWEHTFDFVYFTESDQILIWRTMNHMYDHLRKYPRRMLLPHRLMPYSDRVMTEIHKKTPVNDTHSWQHMSCCLPRQNCDNRLTWISLKDPKVPLINYLGLHVPLGNVDFFLERYRSCTMMPTMLDDYTFCP